MLALSENVREALLANKILYIGGCYLQLVGLLLIFSICKIDLPKPVRFLISDLYDGKRRRGYLLEISDDTAHQQHMEGIEWYNKNLNEELMAKTKLIQELRKK